MTNNNTAVADLRSAAYRYKQASGIAYAEGDDAQAEAYRAAAERISAVADSLPDLPVRCR